MWGSFGQLEEMYRRQFRVEGGRLVYRHYERGKPIPLSEEEMEACIGRYRRMIRLTIYGGVLALMLLIGVVLWLAGDEWMDAGGIWFLTVAAILIFGGSSYWIWNVPTREIRRRVPVGTERDREEVAKEAMSRISWGALAATMSAAIVAPALQIEHWPPESTNDWGWTSLAAFGVAGAIYAAFRKWRLGRN